MFETDQSEIMHFISDGIFRIPPAFQRKYDLEEELKDVLSGIAKENVE